ncbi:MAG: L,D-transpeptidase family protein [Hyphomicrobiaceae bacterium]|nr:L,D-transpeptidase family protein [Hyphomicrobiaceae bacterium]
MPMMRTAAVAWALSLALTAGALAQSAAPDAVIQSPPREPQAVSAQAGSAAAAAPATAASPAADTAPVDAAATLADTPTTAPDSPVQQQAGSQEQPTSPPQGTEALATAIRLAFESAGTSNNTPPLPKSAIETEQRLALEAYYRANSFAPLWMGEAGPTPKAHALAAAIADAAAYGLDPGLIPVPDLNDANATDLAERAKLEISLSMAALTYARHARGGRIPEPAEMLNSNLDRKPQLHDTKVVMQKLALASETDIAAALAALQPVHPQFELLRQAFLKETGGDGRGKLSATAKRLRANMEFWRWMWDDLGELYVFNNIPEFMQRVVLNGEVVRSDRIVVGETGKQSSVFSRPLKEVVLRPRWRVPESIMVHELWPSLRKGGGLMRAYGLEITTKNGDQPRDWRNIDWRQDDIRNYHVWQPPGGKSVLGFVKFSFPSQHTIFMHDTPDKWMFNRGQRTLSHGCLRVRNPMELTEIVLRYDRGWDEAKIKQLIRSGPLDNNVEMQKHIPIHLAYFTAWADKAGKVRFFNDVYGHEKRVTQALDGDWAKINKGRDHLAKPQPRFKRNEVAAGEGGLVPAASNGRRTKKPASVADMISNALGF